MGIDISKLFEATKDSKVPRYKTVNGKKMKIEDFYSLDEFEKEELYTKGIDWTETDQELNILMKQWEEETNPIQKQILFIKYDIKIHEFGEVDDYDRKLLDTLKVQLDKLQEMLK